ncbi:hypothetical protein DFH08DRAFT_831480 [Mycena albidolilacea]|uniref:Small ribosomal subunit protein bS18m n=1 Tax=Mycena albidolilacea TaxID=1033008 RepID=A0AAD7AVB5_9AGAR|nr:hypothetical protein DFH08DRAFT_831480 [Mycena albidolilacea]
MLSLRRLRLPRFYSFSTSVPVRNDSSPMKEMADILTDQSKKTPPIADQGKDNTQGTTIRPTHEYKPIPPNSFIRPYDLSLEGRRFKERPMRRPPQIAPETRTARKKDTFFQLGLDPLKFALHPAIISNFMSEMAMIMPRRQTGLTTKSQRRVAKAIRRAKMMGVIPLHSRLPGRGMHW